MGVSIYAINAAPDQDAVKDVAATATETPVENERPAIDELREIRRANLVSWSAMSRTAMSITGDIRLSEYVLTFQNDESLEIWEVDESTDLTKRLFQVIDQSNPSLLYENFLCDESRAVDYILTESSEAGKVLTLTMIYDNTPYFLRIGPMTVEDVQDIASPFTGNVLGECATYTYAKN